MLLVDTKLRNVPVMERRLPKLRLVRIPTAIRHCPFDQSLQRTAPSLEETDSDAVTVMKGWLQTLEGHALYAERKARVETVFGIFKNVM